MSVTSERAGNADSKLKIRRLGYALGAEVRGVDLSQPLDDAVAAEIWAALLDNIVLCFPDQDLGRKEFSEFTRRFGETQDTHHNRDPEYPSVIVLANKPTTAKSATFVGGRSDAWHIDQSFQVRPGKATFLNAKTLPDVGGDTMFSNLYMAYERLSKKFQEMLAPLSAVHDITMGPLFRTQSPELQAERLRVDPPTVHPVVRTHPETGRPVLFVSEMLSKFVGMPVEESRPLLDFLVSHATRYEFVYRHKWKVNDLIMWDNRCAVHYAVPDYDNSQLRRMLRAVVLGPVSGHRYEAEN